jgi:hypothetical protein
MTELDGDILEDYLPDGPISSLRRIEALYGAIAEAEAGASGGEFGLYLTPGELGNFVATGDNDDRYLVTVQVDLTGTSPELVDVVARPLREEMIDKLGFARYPWGRGIDHSITRRGAKGGSSLDTAVRYCRECLERWTNASGKEPAIGQLAEDHPDGDVIRALQELGSQPDVDEEISRYLEAEYPEGSPRVVATVAIRIDADSLAHPPSGDPEQGFYYPGQLHVLNSGMKARKDLKLARKNLNDSDEPSRGEGACMVTGLEDEVFGTAEDPLAFFTVQHAEKFASLNRENAWRSHPVSSQAALLLQSGASLLERCSDTRDGLRVHSIPYVVDCGVEEARWLHDILTSDDPSDIRAVQRSAEELHPEFGKALRFYVIGVRNDSGDINVLFEIPEVDIYWPRRVAEAHAAAADSSLFHPVAGFSGPGDSVDWRHLGSAADVDTMIRAVTNGSYAHDTLPSSSDDPTTDDVREWLTRSLLTGESVSADRLFEAYVKRIADGIDRSDGDFPTYVILTQFTQLEALARAGLLDAPNRPELTQPPRMTANSRPEDGQPRETAATDGGSSGEPPLPSLDEISADGEISHRDARRYRLERFIEERPALSGTEEAAENAGTVPERRGAFLTGVLVGQLADHQRRERNMNSTLRDQHPADRVTPERIESMYPDLVDRSGVYAGQLGMRGTQLYPETERLLEMSFADAPPSSWSLSLPETRFFYALGISYGADARYQAWQLMDRLDLLDDDEDAPLEQPEA